MHTVVATSAPRREPVTVTGLADFNHLADDAARDALRRCCTSQCWIAAVMAGRPYPSLDILVCASDAAVSQMTESDLRAALAGHPRIGARTAPASWSSREQAAVSDADEETRQALAEGNRAYEQRFGHIYLACATGRSAAELLGFLRSRLANDSATEWRVVAGELAKINEIRLRKLIGGES
jgi:2-oxo-4-hydroxy-4-carboxy-5-ureidoimidazoline decarboxylase